MQDEKTSGHWLDRYRSGYHAWQKLEKRGKVQYYRPCGLVEYFFDMDGVEFEGRSDITALIVMEVRSTLSSDELKRKVLWAWASLRTQHVLMMGKAVDGIDFLPDAAAHRKQRYFVVDQPESDEDIIQAAKNTLVFVGDRHTQVDAEDFKLHALNTARVIDPAKSLSRLFVLPMKQLENNIYTFHLLLVVSHQVADGMTSTAWCFHLVDILNKDMLSVESRLSRLWSPSRLWSRLPPAQEELYPPGNGNRARQRWYWLIARLLRHTKKSLPVALPNPLRRTEPLQHAKAMGQTYHTWFDYSRTPPNPCYRVHGEFPRRAVRHLHSLCRATGTSIGAGTFALVATSMMDMYTECNPSLTTSSSPPPPPVVLAFPVDARPFLIPNRKAALTPDFVALFFSDGITLPFLPATLPTAKRLRLLARLADKQLRAYQKRPRTAQQMARLGAHGASQLVPQNYVSMVERMGERWATSPNHQKHPKTRFKPQGAYPATPFSGATCGVTSTGRGADLLRAAYNLDGISGTDPEFGADYKDMWPTVRAREGEFLVGVGGNEQRLRFVVSYDGNAIDEEKVAMWKNKFEGLLDSDFEPVDGGREGNDSRAKL